MKKTDVLIVGGGLAGASLALLLCHHTDFSVTVVEAADLPLPPIEPLTTSFNARSTALSQGSMLIYQKLGLHDSLMAAAASIMEVDVSTRGYLGQTRMTAAETGVAQLGAVVENRYLGRVLLDALYRQPRIALLSPCQVSGMTRCEDGYQVELNDGQSFFCRLLVAADGARSATREQLGIAAHHQDTGERAVVVNVALADDQPHQGVSYERFLETGPLAFLPLTDNRMTVVWTGKQAFVNELLALSDDDFLQQLQEQATLLGIKIARLGTRGHYPMILTQAAAQAIPFAVVVGNAAHALHPVAAQGFNLTLRDLDCLARCLEGRAHPGDLAVLEQYVRLREGDQALIREGSNLLLELFKVKFAPVAHARQAGLTGLSLLPGLRKAFARRAMGV